MREAHVCDGGQMRNIFEFSLLLSRSGNNMTVPTTLHCFKSRETGLGKHFENYLKTPSKI